ncbi:MAG: hypothetical protein GY862_01120 [Gammaproteobacteria bacterium]|nr:hypothetical protein [Gammaproteobacteria bacterium]
MMNTQFHAYYETKAVVPDNHRLLVDLPADMPTGQVRVAIIYDIPPPEKRGIKALLLAMPAVGEDDDFVRRQDLGRTEELWDI